MSIIDGFVARVNREQLPVDAVVAYRGEQLIGEHRWSPDVPGNIYSHTKSFMVTAVGAAIDRGLLTLDTRLIDMLKDDLPERYDPRLGEIKLRHLLMMSSGFDRPLLMSAQRKAPDFNEDYIDFMLRQPVLAAPGEKFCYSSADSYLAGVMVERATGRNLLDFMMDAFMGDMGIERPEWEVCPRGTPFGGGGMCLKTRDMAKIGILYLNGGVYGGKQLVSADWVKTASTFKIATPSDHRFSCGYCYQFWLDPMPGCYRADGAYGQITHILPDKGAVVAYNCHAETMPAINEAFFEEIYQKL